MSITIRHSIDKIRKRFLWSGGSTNRKKYHLISWDIICSSKAQGGLGVLNLARMNTSLLAKWWFRFKDPTIEGKWKSILFDKYGSTGLDISQVSSFWSGILSDSHMYDVGITRIIGNGATTSFWLYMWYGDCSLYCLFPNLFKIVANPEITISEVLSTSPFSLVFN